MIEWESRRGLTASETETFEQEMSELKREVFEHISHTDKDSALDLILDLAVGLQGSDFGNLQVYREEDGVLEIVRQRGFRSDFLKAFRVVSAKDPCACGRALETSNPIVVSDVEQDSEFAPYLSVARNAGYRAVQSFPMISTDGRVVGVLSTHFRTPGLPSPGKMHLTRLFARHAADVLAG